METASTSYRWFILGLVVLTATVVVAAPTMALPVLFKEISTELGMDLVQIGFIGTMTALTGMVIGLLGGAFAPPLGNSLATVVLSVPFFLWAALAALGFAAFALVQVQPHMAHLSPAAAE